ncbi:MAG: hypothetical protein ACM338_15700 [Betaproteobacteria bacterium]
MSHPDFVDAMVAITAMAKTPPWDALVADAAFLDRAIGEFLRGFA